MSHQQLTYGIKIRKYNDLSENKINGKEFNSKFARLLRKYKLSDEFIIQNNTKVSERPEGFTVFSI